MPSFSFSKRTITSVIAIAGLTLPLTALAGPTNVPLKASVVTQEKMGLNPDCPSGFGGTTTGTGKSTHMGKVSIAASDCITPMGNHYAFIGKLTITAANGDKLSGDYSGSLIPTDTAPAYSFSNATFQITGGTGRFSKASGSVELQGNQDIKTGKGKMEADGTISY
ncbi:hypothetical protein [Nitrosospira sp. Nsp1]|uniref:hypothetical protein n=1 Tax=Nitrosospira sp. Nsp1 TaxID=136547 RepID=UPI000888EE42|nr:hypothetical protein [Nitrosospira sp. Nsp1]SCX46541.1 hypothetical protein SAMN05720354_106125 [Nitrosospira sp. Nsp1]